MHGRRPPPSREKFESLEVILRPSRLRFQDGFQGFEGEGIPLAVWRDRHAAPVRVVVTLMRTLLANEKESVAFEGSYKFSGSKRPEATVVDGHLLGGNRDAGFLLGNFFGEILGADGQRFSLLYKLLRNHVNNFVDPGEGLFAGPARRRGAQAL